MNSAKNWILSIAVSVLLCGGTDAAGGDDVKHEKTIQVAIKVPTPAWSVKIEKVLLDDKGYYVISRLTKADGFFAQVMSTVRDTVKVNGPDLAVRQHYVLGKTWGWKSDESVTFLENDVDLKKRVPNSAVVIELQ